MTQPGDVLQEKLNDAGMTRKELAIRTGVTEKHICTIINGDRAISVAFARKLGYVLENTAYWMQLQSEYDAEQLQIQEENEITQEELDVLKHLHDIMSYFIECGYIYNNCGASSKVMQLRDFLCISNLTMIPHITYNAAYRAQLTTNINVDPYVLFAWQRLCEKKTEDLTISQIIDIDALHSNINNIRSLMFNNIDSGIQKLQRIFADCGIAFQVVKNFRGAPVQGFIKETPEKRLILCLTIRGKRADCFWFTLFHEIAHILNGDNKNRFVDFDSISDAAEERANCFARDTLIPPDEYRKFVLSRDCTSWESIESFAKTVNVMPFIVLGRLQNDGYIDWSEYTNKVVRYAWA